MAEQELAENNESTAAAMAAAAVAADIDTISDDRQNEADAVTSANRERGAEPSSSTAAVSSQQPAEIDGELLRLWARKQHAEIERVEKPLLADPFQFLDEKPVHHRDLPGRATKAKQADLQPNKQRFFKSNTGLTIHTIIF